MNRILSLLKHSARLAALLFIVVPLPAHAYLDPGTGSTIIQVVIASLAAAGYFVKVFWRQIKKFFADLFSKKPPTDGDR